MNIRTLVPFALLPLVVAAPALAADVASGGAPAAAAGTEAPPGLFSAESLIAFLTLTALEVVLGIDNVVFISILSSKLPPEKQDKIRRIGLLLAMVMRIALLFAIGWVMSLTKTWFTVLEGLTFSDGHGGKVQGLAISGKDMVLLLGGLFLIWKATKEIHHKIEGPADAHKPSAGKAAVSAILAQIIALDIVFSLDSVITAVAMARHIGIMIAAVIVAVGVMMVFAGPIARFVERHPAMKVLALSFLLMIGVMLVADGLHFHIPKGYVYFAMAFALLVETINIKSGSRRARKGAHAAPAPATGPTP